jgi:hypothetical protein
VHSATGDARVRRVRACASRSTPVQHSAPRALVVRFRVSPAATRWRAPPAAAGRA